MPNDVRARFGTTVPQWNDEIDRWWRVVVNSVNDFGRSNADATNAVVAKTEDIILTQDGFTVALEEERTARIDADGALGRWLVSVSAIASSSQNIAVQSTPPGSPTLGYIWVDNTDITNPVTYEWNGAAWVERTDFVLAAAVSDERTARVTADGFLEGKYTLTVTAGNIVTGMNITSSTGTGTNISSVTFVASDFKIYNGITGVTTFDISGTTVRLGGTLVVNTTGNKVYIGVGSYGNSNTAWYVDGTGLFSLGDKLTWNGTTLTITGSLTATTGTIGGWTINATTISANNAVLDSAGQLVLGTSNDVIILSATNATYRMWAGNATAGSASFSVTKTGLLSAVGASISGTVTSSIVIVGHTAQYTNSTTSNFQVINNGGTANAVQNLAFGTATPNFEGWVAGGLIGSETQTLTGRGMKLKLVTYGSGGGGWINGGNASVRLVATQDHTNTARGTKITFHTTTNGTLTENQVLLLDQDGTATFSGVISGNGSGLTTLSATNLGSGTVPDARFPATLPAASGANLTALNASNISSGTLANARLPSAISVTSLATANFNANVASAVDVGGVNFRVFSDAGMTAQTARIEAATGFYYVAGNQVVGARGTRGAATITEVVALLDAWGAWA